MKAFNIRRPNEALRPAIQDKINNLTKPKGSLGMLESLAEQICMVQQTLTPTLNHPQKFIRIFIGNNRKNRTEYLTLHAG